MQASMIVAEIRTLAHEIGRQPTRKEWKRRFNHGNCACEPHGGYGILARDAMSQISDSTRSNEFTPQTLPDSEIPIVALIARKKQDFNRLSEYHDAVKLIDVRVNVDGPIAIVHMGDPHLDDDGTDIARVERDTDIIRTTPGMFGANVGDLTNNWIGRLAHLNAEQSTKAADAWRLAEWYLTRCPFIYLVGGNHDLWSGHRDPLTWIMGRTNALFQASAIRINLVFPNGREVRVNARHDFKGSSIYNAAHGVTKAITFGWRDHLATCGHLHRSCLHGPIKDPMTGLLSWGIQLATYKVFDAFATAKGYTDQNVSPSCTTIINPYAERETQLITPMWDIEDAADNLRWRRRQWEKGKKVA